MASNNTHSNQGPLASSAYQKYPNLSRGDFAHIERLGIPVGNTSGLYVVDHLGQISFTPRGYDFVRAAFERFGIQENPLELNYSELLTKARHVTETLSQDNKKRMRESLHAGRLPRGESDWARMYLR